MKIAIAFAFCCLFALAFAAPAEEKPDQEAAAQVYYSGVYGRGLYGGYGGYGGYGYPAYRGFGGYGGYGYGYPYGGYGYGYGY